MVMLTSISTFITTFICYGRHAVKSLHGKSVNLDTSLRRSSPLLALTRLCYFRSATSIGHYVGRLWALQLPLTWEGEWQISVKLGEHTESFCLWKHWESIFLSDRPITHEDEIAPHL